MTPGLQFCFIIKIGKKAIHLFLGRLGRMSDHYVSLIFPIHKSSQPSHALPHPPPQEPLLLLFTSKPKSSKSITIIQHFPPTNILEPVVIYKEHKGLAEQHYSSKHILSTHRTFSALHSFLKVFLCSFSKENMVTDSLLI